MRRSNPCKDKLELARLNSGYELQAKRRNNMLREIELRDRHRNIVDKDSQLLIVIDFQLLLATGGRVSDVELRTKQHQIRNSTPRKKLRQQWTAYRPRSEGKIVEITFIFGRPLHREQWREVSSLRLPDTAASKF